MADPLKIAGITGTVVSGLSSIIQTYESGKLARIISQHNANMSELEAELVREQTADLIEQLNTSESRELAASRAASVGEGFALDSGTNLALEGDIIQARNTDREIIRKNGSLEEARLAIQAGQELLEGEIAESTAKVQSIQTLFGTTSDLVKRFDKKDTSSLLETK